MFWPPAQLWIVELKNRSRPITSIPVFTIGQTTPAVTTPASSLFFASSLYTRPDIQPAAAPLPMQMMMQAMGLMPISSMTTPPSHPAMPVRSTTVPNTPPSNAPAELPYTAAPMMIGARASVIGNGPKRTKLLRTCSTTMMDANRARPVCLRSPLRGVALLILNSFLLSLRSRRMRRSLIIYTDVCSVNF